MSTMSTGLGARLDSRAAESLASARCPAASADNAKACRLCSMRCLGLPIALEMLRLTAARLHVVQYIGLDGAILDFGGEEACI